LIGIFTPIGLAASIESLLAHYDVVSSGFCTFSATFNCDVVNKSAYAEILGIPVAALGLAAYLLFGFALLWLWHHPNDRLLTFALALAVGGLTFSLYLTYIEAFVLYTWCIVCLTSLFCILAITYSLFALRRIDVKIPETTN
jgi:uncharacterized membrane protein